MALRAIQEARMERSLQDTHSPEGICFGCGPRNDKGLHVQSFVRGDEVVCDWTPSEHHQAFPGIVNGGIVGALLDCHLNWTAAHHLMRAKGLDRSPCTVTADYHVHLRRPTPVDRPLHITARVVESEGDRAVVEGEMTSDGKVTATCRGTFVAVSPGHPAFHRW
jgi:acyl-coenzyme A thioesterase PaaI-like protein